MLLKDKVAVVTGGSSGIGAATVRMLADEGAAVVVCYNKGEDRARALIAATAQGQSSCAAARGRGLRVGAARRR